jgi:3-methylcrotonyl-CoA carboxylase alpha subunit
MAEAAVQAAKSVSYEGAGTVEFILGEAGEFYFLEMNTRLQVEHPVTELTTGLDLVELQIRVAEGGKLPETPKQNGHAIEVRVYAEDPSNHFLPSIGKIHALSFPEGEGIRIDSGVVSGSEISIYYDPMIAKIIVWSEEREEAIDKMISVLEETIVFGPITNISFLKELVNTEGYRNGKVSTHFIATHEVSLNEKKVSIQERLALSGIASSVTKDADPWVLPEEFVL